MTRRERILIAISLVLTLLLMNAQAFAQEDPEPDNGELPGSDEVGDLPAGTEAEGETTEQDEKARELYLVGRDLYEAGRYQAALEVFEEAHKLSPRPLLLLSLASTYERVGRYEDALTALRQYEPHAEEDKRSVLDKRIQGLEERLAKIESAAAKPETTEKPIVEPAPAPLPAEGTDLAIWGWTVGGVGLAMGITGGVLVALGESDHVLAKDDAQKLTPQAYQQLVDDGDMKKTTGFIVAGVGGAALITGIVLLVLDDDEADTTPQAGLIPTNDGALMTLTGRF